MDGKNKNVSEYSEITAKTGCLCQKKWWATRILNGSTAGGVDFTNQATRSTSNKGRPFGPSHERSTFSNTAPKFNFHLNVRLPSVREKSLPYLSKNTLLCLQTFTYLFPMEQLQITSQLRSVWLLFSLKRLVEIHETWRKRRLCDVNTC